MQKKIVILLALAVGLSFMAFGVPQSQAAPIKLTYSNFFPPTHIQSKLAESWCREVEKRTNGRVKVEYYAGQTLTKARQCYDGVVTGLSDIGFSVLAYTRGRFPVMAAVDLPLGHGPGLVHTKGKMVSKLEDMKGLKLRGHGTSALVIRALGGTPVPMPMPETYQSLQKGVVEGSVYPWEANKGWKLGEVTDYCTAAFSAAYTTSFFVVMNKAKWNSLPADVKKIISAINEEWIIKHGEAWDSSDFAGIQFFLSKGGVIIGLNSKESARWKEAVSPLIDDFVAKMNKKGFKGREIVDFTMKTLEDLNK